MRTDLKNTDREGAASPPARSLHGESPQRAASAAEPSVSSASARSHLLDLPIGATATIACVRGEGAFRRRLLEMGLLPGTRLRIVRRVAVGHLVELEVRGGLLSLREAQAQTIELEIGGGPAATSRRA